MRSCLRLFARFPRSSAAAGPAGRHRAGRNGGPRLVPAYLGNESEIAGGREGDRLVFVLPDVQKGAVLRIDDR